MAAESAAASGAEQKEVSKVYAEIADVPEEVRKGKWDGAEWTKKYKAHEAEAREAGRPLWRDENLSSDRLLVGASTKYLSTTGHSIPAVDEKGEFVAEAPDTSLSHTTWYKDEYAKVTPECRRYNETLVRIVNADTIDFVRELIKRGKEESGKEPKVVALNMANQFEPGGGFERGRLAQEEVLCDRTTLHSCLDPKEYDSPNGFGEFTAAINEGVHVLRKGMDCGFALLRPEDRWQINFVSAAAYDRHKLPKEEQRAPLSPEQFAGYHAKISSILAACAAHGADIVVLGAFGCGAFANPPDQVAKVFANVIRRSAGVFIHVYFAILGAPNDFKLPIFHEVLCGAAPEGDPAEFFAPDLTKDNERGAKYPAAAKNEWLPSGKMLPPCPLMCKCKNDSPEHIAAFQHLPFAPPSKPEEKPAEEKPVETKA